MSPAIDRQKAEAIGECSLCTKATLCKKIRNIGIPFLNLFYGNGAVPANRNKFYYRVE